MRGTVYPHRSSSGTKGWQLQVDAGRDETGKRIRITKSFQLKREADAELARLLQESQDGLLVRPSPKTVGEFLNEWLREHGKHCERKTAERYSQLAGYVSHALGHVALCDLSTLMLERLYNSLHEAGGKDGRPLSARTVKHIHDTLRCALNTALRWKLLKVNPAIPCQRPKVTRKEARVLENAQLEWLLDAAQRHPWLYALLVVAIATGLRRGETVGPRVGRCRSDAELSHGSSIARTNARWSATQDSKER